MIERESSVRWALDHESPSLAELLRSEPLVRGTFSCALLRLFPEIPFWGLVVTLSPR